MKRIAELYFKAKLIAAIMVVISSDAVAQDFIITRIGIQASDLIITYALIDSAKNRTYTINLYSSREF